MEFRPVFFTKGPGATWPCALCREGAVSLDGVAIQYDGPPVSRGGVQTVLVCEGCLYERFPSMSEALSRLEAVIRVAADLGVDRTTLLRRLAAQMDAIDYLGAAIAELGRDRSGIAHMVELELYGVAHPIGDPTAATELRRLLDAMWHG